MALARIVQKIQTVVSTDLDQFNRVADSVQILDDSSQSRSGTLSTVLVAGSGYTEVALPSGIGRIGFLHIETDAPILCRLNGIGEIPISPVIVPGLISGYPSPGPSMLPSIQKGILSLRSGVATDGNSVSLTTVELSCPGTVSATVKVILVGE